MEIKVHLTALSMDNYHKNDILLGEWCTPNCKNKSIPYHWDDYEEMHNDFLIIEKIYEELLVILGKILNEYHNFCFTNQSWRILIGPWLSSIVHCIYDRSKIINDSFLRNGINDDHKICWYEINNMELISISSASSSKSLRYSDFINQYIFQEIIKNNFEVINKKLINHKFKFNFDINYPNVNYKRGFFIKKILFFIDFVRQILSKLGIYKVITNGTRFSKIQDFLLSTINFSFYFPGFINDVVPINKVILNNQVRIQLRNKLNKNITNSKLFKKLTTERKINQKLIKSISHLIFELMPANFIENFKKLHKNSIRQNWTNKKVIILTANSYNANDTFCMSAAIAINKENQSKLYVIQHGGHFGTGRFNSSENHQRKIAYKYLTWGWEEDCKTIPLGLIKPLKRYNVNSFKSKEVLLICMELNRYSYVSYSGPHGPQWLVYQNKLENLASTIASSGLDLTIRTKPIVESWNSMNRWKTKNFNIDNQRSFFDSCRDSKIVISTYNAATFLETIFIGIPTLMFWDEIMWDMRAESKKIFNELKEVKVFHNSEDGILKTLKSAKSMGYFNWWNDYERQKVIKKFKKNYCRENYDYLKTFSRLKHI